MTTEPTEDKLKQIKRRFLQFHRQRLQRIRDDLRERQRTFLDLVPLLLHINHPKLPGFVSSTTPSGITDFQPGNTLVRLARKHHHGFDHQRRAHDRYWIQGLYLMSSLGGMTRSRRKSLDFWVCHHPDIDEDDLYLLTSKLQRLEERAAKVGLDSRFIPINPEKFRQGEHPVSGKATDSGHRMLLLESFYRDAVHLAGCYPLWWLAPAKPGTDYQRYSRNLFERNLVDASSVLDFGPLQQITPEELFGDIRQRLFKAIDSPYRGLLALLLREQDGSDYPDVRWLCDDLKAALHEGAVELDALDSDLLIYRRVEGYLLGRGEPSRLDLARRSLYFRTTQSLSRYRAQDRNSWRFRQMEQLTADWGWSREILTHLDKHRSWKIHEASQEQSQLVQELSRSYRLLAAFGKHHGDARLIKPRKLRILGRKLYASLESRPGKIDLIYPAISTDLSEPLLSLHRQGERYQLYLDDLPSGQLADQLPLKQSRNLLEVLAWAQLNGLIGNGAVLKSGIPTHPNQVELQGKRNALSRLFPDRAFCKTTVRALEHEPRLLQCTLLINPEGAVSSLADSAEMQLVSDRSDPLSFSSKRLCLIDCIEQLATTSWGEMLSFRYQGPQALLEALVRYLRMTVAIDRSETPPLVESFCFNAMRGDAIARRVQDVFRYIGHIYGPEGPGPRSRYILPLGRSHFMLHHDGEHYLWRQLADHDQLMRALEEPAAGFSPIIPDPQALTDTPLPAICARRKPGRLQLFFQIHGHNIDTYVMDEQGSIFLQTQSDSEPARLLSHQYRFLTSLLQRRGLRSNQSMTELLDRPLALYQLKRNANGTWRTIPASPPQIELDEELLQLRLIGAAPGEEEQMLLSCGERSFSSVEYGDAIYATLTRHILSVRKDRHSYPIHISGIEPQDILSGEEWQTMRLLAKKRRIEQRLKQELNRALEG